MQQAARDVITFNYERNTDLQEAVKSWAELKEERQNYSSSFQFTDGEAYWSLIRMGPSIAAQMMLEYYNDQSGWWHELLHELIHGHTHSQAQATACYFKSVLFESWKDWFEHKNYSDAPYGPDARAREEQPWMVPRLPRGTRAIDWDF